MRILTLPGVFRPRSDAALLACTMHEQRLARGARVLDLFTGSGALAIAAAQSGAREVVAVDVSLRAVLSARLNAWRNGVAIDVRRGDLWQPVAGEQFDLILANPPYLPSARETPPRSGAARAWEAGADGRALLDRLCREARAHLQPGGALLIVQSHLAGEHATRGQLRAAGLRPEVLTRQRGRLGPLMAERTELLEARGLLRPGEREEEVVVIAGARSPVA